LATNIFNLKQPAHMKTRLLIIVLLSLMPSIIYCQEEHPKEKYFHSVDVGFGTGNLHAIANVALSSGLGKYVANFIDYNYGFDKSSSLSHEVSIKFGPYLRFNRNSYLAISSGFSFYIKEDNYRGTSVNGTYIYQSGPLFSLPVELKLNLDMHRGVCIGLKGSNYRLIDRDCPYPNTLLLFLAYAW
jgi:hypothetical protein